MGICGAIVYIGLGLTSATNAALIYASSPVFIVLIEAALHKKPINWQQALGIALALTGVVIILFKGEIRRIIQFHFNLGDLYIALASLSWAIYSVLLKNRRLATYGTLPVFTMIAMAGVIVLLPFFLWERGTAGDVPLQLAPWLSILGVALMPSVMAFLIYKYGIRTVGPSRTALFLYFMPVYAALLAIVFLGEHLHIYHFGGLLLVMSGVIMATLNSGNVHQSTD
jgi:drug/metabolite transporter (DMT)-like permease